MSEPDNLANRDFRVRQLVFKAVIDVYDNNGALADRPVTQEIIINEAHFDPAIVNLLSRTTNLGRGFVMNRTKSQPPVPVPVVVSE